MSPYLIPSPGCSGSLPSPLKDLPPKASVVLAGVLSPRFLGGSWLFIDIHLQDSGPGGAPFIHVVRALIEEVEYPLSHDPGGLSAVLKESQVGEGQAHKLVLIHAIDPELPILLNGHAYDCLTLWIIVGEWCIFRCLMPSDRLVTPGPSVLVDPLRSPLRVPLGMASALGLRPVPSVPPRELFVPMRVPRRVPEKSSYFEVGEGTALSMRLSGIGVVPYFL